jgi:hypothetical protein
LHWRSVCAPEQKIVALYKPLSPGSNRFVYFAHVLMLCLYDRLTDSKETADVVPFRT